MHFLCKRIIDDFEDKVEIDGWTITKEMCKPVYEAGDRIYHTVTKKEGTFIKFNPDNEYYPIFVEMDNSFSFNTNRKYIKPVSSKPFEPAKPKKRKRAEVSYYRTTMDNKSLIEEYQDYGDPTDNALFKNYAYFLNKDKAIKAGKKIRKLLKKFYKKHGQ
jgi:hypothetical protein